MILILYFMTLVALLLICVGSYVWVLEGRKKRKRALWAVKKRLQRKLDEEWEKTMPFSPEEFQGGEK